MKAYRPGPEQQIQNLILKWLWLQPGQITWRNNNQVVFDKTKGVFRRRGRYELDGVADILGIWRGKPLAIEVKSKLGEGTTFRVRFSRAGGIAIVARSLTDVVKVLDPKQLPMVKGL